MNKFSFMGKKILSVFMIMVLFSSTIGIGISSDWFAFKAFANESEEQVQSEEEINIVTSGTCGDNVTWSFDESTGTLTISGTGEMESRSQISDSRWYGFKDNILMVDIKPGVTSIGDYVFANCPELTKVTIPDTVTSIGKWAFANCTRLTSVTIPDSVTSIGARAFVSCFSLTNVTIPDSVTSIGVKAFGGCHSLTNITVLSANAVYSSDEHGVLFNKDKTVLICYPIGNTRTSYTIPDSVTSIGDYAFSYCSNLTKVTIPDSVTSIGEWAFNDCYILASVAIPDSVTSIGNFVFACCSSFTSVTIPDGVTSIDDCAFLGCVRLTSVAIPDSVTSIGYGAFDSCDRLTDVYFSGTEEEWGLIKVVVDDNEPLLNATKHFKKTYSSEDNDVVLEYNDDCFDSEVQPQIIQKELSSKEINFLIAKGSYPKLKYDISMLSADGLPQQPINGSVKIKIKIPEELKNSDKIQIRHFPKDGTDNEIFSVKKGNLLFENGYMVFEVSHFSYFFVCAEADAPTIKIRNNPGTATVNYGDDLWLTAEVTNLPEGAEVWWFFESGFGASGKSIGTTVYRDEVVTVKILDSEGNALKDADGNEISDTQKIVCKSNIWLRIISFFKNLFRIERTIVQSL